MKWNHLHHFLNQKRKKENRVKRARTHAIVSHEFSNSVIQNGGWAKFALLVMLDRAQPVAMDSSRINTHKRLLSGGSLTIQLTFKGRTMPWFHRRRMIRVRNISRITKTQHRIEQHWLLIRIRPCYFRRIVRRLRGIKLECRNWKFGCLTFSIFILETGTKNSKLSQWMLSNDEFTSRPWKMNNINFGNFQRFESFPDAKSRKTYATPKNYMYKVRLKLTPYLSLEFRKLEASSSIPAL